LGCASIGFLPLLISALIRDDPYWEDWHSEAVDIQGGVSASSSEEDDELSGVSVVLPETCVCQHCRCCKLINLFSIIEEKSHIVHPQWVPHSLKVTINCEGAYS
jgi:hypothetical protein